MFFYFSILSVSNCGTEILEPEEIELQGDISVNDIPFSEGISIYHEVPIEYSPSKSQSICRENTGIP